MTTPNSTTPSPCGTPYWRVPAGGMIPALLLTGILIPLTAFPFPAESGSTSHAKADAVEEPVYDLDDTIQPPRVLHTVQPEYTPQARIAGVQGSVLLRLVVTSKGAPTQVEVVRSLEKGLDENAVKCVEQWQFAPGKKDNRTVAVRLRVEIEFREL